MQGRSTVEALSRAMWGDALSVATVAPRWAADIVERLAAAGYAIAPTAPTEAMVNAAPNLRDVDLYPTDVWRPMVEASR